ncbi:metal ABC transporter permease [Candidatus Gracilibacteria bacterium]|nr:metal ABC transporter permease [Candidatus Gracilibacteria bacterium]MBS9775150.1 metal ABC transporter permease [Candidatus Gracilibacteria bacterium]
MFEILSYSFFQKALISGILLSIISSILGVFIVLRKEANITHSISHFLFLGIALSLLCSGNYYFFAGIFALFASCAIFFIEKTSLITKESTKEIISQGGIAGAIFALSFLNNLTLDINSFLFGSILLVQDFDIFMIGIFLVIILGFFIFFGRKFLSIIINQDIAKSMGTRTEYYNFIFLILVSIFIALSIKVFGILLIGAFLVIPTNTAKIVASSLKQVFMFSLIFSLLGVIIGLFSSHLLDTSSGATIVLVLICFFIGSLFFQKK